MSKRSYRSFALKVNSDVEIRTETLMGREYSVVPVIAMVEGVRFGATQSSAELGLAHEFGENPLLWNNRPLVLNHPQDEDGNFISANQAPEVLEQYAFGFTLNSYVDDKKLKLEAWIDVDRVESLGGDFQDVYDRIIAQEEDDTVEVSVGFFTDVEEKKGTFKGQSYTGIWRNIRPDHLAILPNSTGACSVEDGCGIPRIQQEANMPEKKLQADKTCGCGGTGEACTCEEHADAPKGQSRTSVPKVNGIKTQTHKERRESLNTLLINTQTIDPDLMSSDVLKLLRSAVSNQFGNYSYVYGYTNDFVIFETVDNEWNWAMYKIGVNVQNDSVEFVGEKSEVILLTKLVDVKDQSAQNVQTQESDMGVETENENKDPKQEEAKVQETPKVQTTEEYIAAAPAEVREALEASMRTHASAKSERIKTITAHEGNKFTEEFLKTQSLEMLDNMVALLPVSFKGQSGGPQNIHIEGEKDSGETVAAPKVFEFKKGNNQQAA